MNCFDRCFWLYLTNGRKVESRSHLYNKLSVDDEQVYDKAKKLL